MFQMIWGVFVFSFRLRSAANLQRYINSIRGGKKEVIKNSKYRFQVEISPYVFIRVPAFNSVDPTDVIGNVQHNHF